MSIKIKKGSVLVYRVFDVAEEANLAKIEDMLKATTSRARLRFTSAPRQAVIMANAPVTVGLGESELQLAGQTVKVETFAKVWDYGVISILFQIPITQAMSWDQLIELSTHIELATSIDDLARVRSQELVSSIHSALRDPHFWPEFEDYVIFFLEELEGLQNTAELSERADTARLILAENTIKLAESSRRATLEGTFQYSETDIAIIDWNAAIVLEPSGRKEVPEVIEFALTHMLEMRYYDDLLDQRLTTLYDSIEESRSHYFSNRFTALSREASTRYIEFSEFMERVDNSLKVVGDSYLARIFRAASQKFRMPEWESNIQRKIKLFSNLSELLQGEINVTRSLWLELTIVVLILFELCTTLLKIAHH